MKVIKAKIPFYKNERLFFNIKGPDYKNLENLLPELIGGARVKSDEGNGSEPEPDPGSVPELDFEVEDTGSVPEPDVEDIELDTGVDQAYLVVTQKPVAQVEASRALEPYEQLNKDATNLISNLEEDLDPMEVSVFASILINANYSIKETVEYEKYSNQLHLSKSYVPRKRQGSVLWFNQPWLQAVLRRTDPLSPDDSKEFWESLETVDDRGKKNPMSLEKILDGLKAFPEPGPDDLWIQNGQPVNVIRQIIDKQIRRQQRELGPISQVYPGPLGLSIASYQTGSLTSYNLERYPVNQANLNVCRDARIECRTLDYVIEPVERKTTLDGAHLQIVGYYRLPIGFKPRNFYSNFWLGDSIESLNSQIGDSKDLQKKFQREIVQKRNLDDLDDAFKKIVPDSILKMWDTFPSVLENSRVLDLRLADSLLRYFNVNLKWMNHDDLKAWSTLAINKSNGDYQQQDYRDYLNQLRRPDSSGYYRVIDETNVLKLPFYLIWHEVLDSPDNGEPEFLNRQKEHLERYGKEGLNKVWESLNLNKRLSGLDTTKTALDALGPPFNEKYIGLIVNFPENPTQESLAAAKIWVNEKPEGYRERDYYQLWRQKTALERLKQIKESLDNINNDVRKTLRKLERDQKQLETEGIYYSFQGSLVKVNLRAIAGPLGETVRVAKSPELLRLRKIVQNMPEFERLKYLGRLMRKYSLDPETGALRDSDGAYVCCVHVLARIELGPEQMLEKFRVNETDTHCRYCGAELGDPQFDDEEEYVNGRQERTHAVMFYQPNQLEREKTKNELTKFASNRFLTLVEPITRDLSDTVFYELLTGFQEQLPAQLGLIGPKGGRSLFLQPDENSYEYLKTINVNTLADRWFDYLFKSLPNSSSSTDEERVVLVDTLVNSLKRVYVSHMIYVARMAFLTALLAKTVWLTHPEKIRQEDLEELTKNSFLQNIVRELLRNKFIQAYRMKGQAHAPDLPSELTTDILKNIPLYPVDAIIDEKGSLLPVILNKESSEKWTQAYWESLYKKLVPIYLDRLVDKDILQPEFQLEALRKLKQPEIINQTDLIPEEPAKEDKLVYCRYQNQQRYQTLARLYALFDKVTNTIQSLTEKAERHSCFGRSSLKCNINDQYYYINRLISGEVPIDNLANLFTIISTKKEFSEFQEEFLKLLQPVKSKEEPVEEKDLLEEIRETYEKLLQIKKSLKELKECQISDPLWVHSLKKGGTRLVRAIEYPLEYKFLEDPEKLPKSKSEILPETQTRSETGARSRLFDDIGYTALAKDMNNNELMQLGLLQDLENRRANQQFMARATEPEPAEVYLRRLGHIPAFTQQNEKSLYEHNFPKATPSAFYLWRKAKAGKATYTADLTEWLALEGDELEFWIQQASLESPVANPCLLRELSPGPTETKWRRLQQLVVYIEIFRFYLILFKNSIIFPRTDNVQVLNPAMQELLKDLKQAEITGFFRNDGKPPVIIPYEKISNVEPENVITFVTTDEQIDNILNELVNSDQTDNTDNTDKATKILQEKVWSIIDCIDENKEPGKGENKEPRGSENKEPGKGENKEPRGSENKDKEPGDEDQEYQKRLDQTELILKYVLLGDILRNYRQTRKRPDEKYYVKLVQMIWFIIVQMENVRDMSSEYHDLSIKYYYFQKYEKIRTQKRESTDETIIDENIENLLAAVGIEDEAEGIKEPGQGDEESEESESGDDENEYGDDDDDFADAEEGDDRIDDTDMVSGLEYEN